MAGGGTGPSAPSAALPRKSSPSGIPAAAGPRNCSPSTGGPSAYPRKSSPSKPKNAEIGVFSARWANFFALTHTSGRAGRTISRTRHNHVATLKPMTPLLALTQANVKPPSPLRTPKQQPLKPTTPLQPKNARKTPMSDPQRRWRFQPAHLTGPQRRRRFQLRLGLREQRRQGFQPHTDTSEQRRHGFQTTAHQVCGLRLRRQQAPMRPLPRKLARNSIEPTHQQHPETLK